MKILVVGGGGREHALIRALKQSTRVSALHCAPGNGGISADAVCHNVAATDLPGMVELAQKLQPDLVVVAPDDPLVLGMVDALEAAGFRAFGPNAAAAAIEGSKVFAKDLMKTHGIPTAKYAVFEEPAEAIGYLLQENTYPVVIKADGLALGKGVVIAENAAAAAEAIHRIMEERVFGASGSRVVIEEYLTGPEISVLSFTDGETVCPMVSSMDHKRAMDGDKGLNTGGMGTISPNPFYTDDVSKICMDTIFLPTVRALSAEGRPFKGCLYFGLMLTPVGPKVIEYNCRFGDPEAQVVLPLLKTDLVEVMEHVIEGRLSDLKLEWDEGAAACVILASGGYPAAYKKGILIEGLLADGQVPGGIVYHAGTVAKENKFYTAGGRVLGVTARGPNLAAAVKQAYTAADAIRFEGMQYRTDIGKRALESVEDA